MAARLLANVALRHPKKGAVVVLLKGDEVPAWADSLVGQHLRAKAEDAVGSTEDTAAPGTGNHPGGTPQASEDAVGSPQGDDESDSVYADLTVAQLREEVDTRNALRSEADQIVLPSHRKADITSALETDDIR